MRFPYFPKYPSGKASALRESHLQIPKPRKAVCDAASDDKCVIFLHNNIEYRLNASMMIDRRNLLEYKISLFI